MKPVIHAKASAKVFGGEYTDYIEIHRWFDQFRFAVKDPRHRLFLHNTAGVLMCEQVFGDEITNSNGKQIAVRDVAEHHIIMDVGEMRTPQEWLDNINDPEWVKPVKSKLEKDVERAYVKNDEIDTSDLSAMLSDSENHNDEDERELDVDRLLDEVANDERLLDDDLDDEDEYPDYDDLRYALKEAERRSKDIKNRTHQNIVDMHMNVD